MDDEYWRAYRVRARRRAAAIGLLFVIGPLGIIVAVLNIVAPKDHPAGDPRDDIVVRLVVCGAFIAFDLALMIGSARLLRGGGRDDAA
jgi:hypothetical protein